MNYQKATWYVVQPPPDDPRCRYRSKLRDVLSLPLGCLPPSSFDAVCYRTHVD